MDQIYANTGLVHDVRLEESQPQLTSLLSSRSDACSDSTAASTVGFTSARYVPFRIAILVGKCNDGQYVNCQRRAKARPSPVPGEHASFYDTIKTRITNRNRSLSKNASFRECRHARISALILRGSMLSQGHISISGKPEDSITHISLNCRQIENGKRVSCRRLLHAAPCVLYLRIRVIRDLG